MNTLIEKTVKFLSRSECEELVTVTHKISLASLMNYPRKRNLRVCVVDGLVRSSKDYSL